MSQGRLAGLVLLATVGSLAVPGSLLAQTAITSVDASPPYGSWVAADGPNDLGRDLATATLLDDGRVLVAGGRQAVRTPGYPPIVTASASSGIWDPVVATWAALPDMPFPHARATAVHLLDGRVMIFGGQPTSAQGYSLEAGLSTLLFDPVRSRWTSGDPMHSVRDGGTGLVLADGTVLAVGGPLLEYHEGSIARPGPATERWQPTSRKWASAGEMAQARYDLTATLLPDGRALVAGGEGLRRTLASTEVFDPEAGTWSGAAPMSAPRARHAAVALLDGRVLVAGGYGLNGFTASAELYDPLTDSWSPVGSLSSPRDRFALVLLPDGRAVAIGGGGPGEGGSYAAVDAVEIFDPASGTWSGAAPLPDPRWAPAAVALADGTVVVIGGERTGSSDTSRQRWPDTVLTFAPPSPG